MLHLQYCPTAVSNSSHIDGTTISHIILSPVWPVLALLSNGERQDLEQLVPISEILRYDPKPPDPKMIALLAESADGS